jgi:hypothetical protein
MSVYKKLMQARIALQSKKLKKSGLNKFAGYEYFELGDFLPEVQSIFSEVGLCGIVSFAPDVATLTITDSETGQTVEIKSPMAEANLKGCHPIQNLGAVETYTRRYLWVTAMEIVEHDALDSTTGKDAPRHTATQGALVSPERMTVIDRVREAILDRMASDDVVGAYGEYVEIKDVEEKTALWGKLPSNIRSALKKHGETLKGEK